MRMSFGIGPFRLYSGGGRRRGKPNPTAQSFKVVVVVLLIVAVLVVLAVKFWLTTLILLAIGVPLIGLMYLVKKYAPPTR